MRIIGGSARSRVLQTLRGQDTRPTQAMVREALFSMLQGETQGSRLLDLFAGSGALGLEGLSRGASSAVFVDASRQASAMVLRNIQSLGFSEQATLLTMDWQRALPRLAAENKVFDLVFLDPPYRLPLDPVLKMLLSCRLLTPEATLALEHGKGQGPEIFPGFSLRRRRAYGDTEITLLDFKGENANG